jgi:beta-glucosidase-like glycosyl hydrolase
MAVASFFLLQILLVSSHWPISKLDGTIDHWIPDPDDDLDAGASVPPCSTPPTNGYPYCNPNLPYAQRVTDLISRIPLEEKIRQFSNNAAGIPTLQLPPYEWWSEALHGVASSPGVSFKYPTPVATNFPQIIGMGATFDIALVNKMAGVISTEARAMANVGHAGLTFWAPNINIFRDPRWGRGQETPGEDPYLTSEYVAAFVTGMQEGEDYPKYLKVSSCCKHYAGYSLEDADGYTRYDFDGNISAQDWADTYSVAFQNCVERGQVSAIMCSYNANNGIPSCADEGLLTDDLKTSWGFNGYVTGDCQAVDCVYSQHHYTNTTMETCQVVFDAGLDIDCGNFLISYLDRAIALGFVHESDLNTHLYNLFMVQMRLGYYDPPDIQRYRQIPTSAINTKNSQDLSLQAARESIVLLKNTNNVLPFNRAGVTPIKRIAVIGPNANAATTQLGNYYGIPPYIVTPLEGLGAFATVTYVYGCDINSTDQSGFSAAISAAQTADATVLVMGLNQTIESEGNDRVYINFPGVQESFILEVAAAAKGPVILVLMSGSSVDISLEKSSSDIDAILWVGYPGQSGGSAIADVIFGAYNPAGRLPITFHSQDFINSVLESDMGMRPNASSPNPGRTYRFFTGTPVYPFGYGLSYTNFTYNWLSSTAFSAFVPASKIPPIRYTHSLQDEVRSGAVTVVSVNVTNTGTVAGDDVVIYYVIPPNAGQNGAPLKYVAGFQRIHLYPGQFQIVSFSVSSQDLRLADEDGMFRTKVGTWLINIGDLTGKIIVE